MNVYELNSIIDNEDELQIKYKNDFNISDEKFKFDKFQLISFREIDKFNNVLVSAPTSSGKTAVAEYALFNSLKKVIKLFIQVLLNLYQMKNIKNLKIEIFVQLDY